MNPRWLCAIACLVLVWAGAGYAPQHALAQNEDQATEAYNGAVRLHNLPLYEEAEKAWQQFIKDYPANKRVPDAKYYLGICQFNLSKYDAAIATFTDLIAKHADFARLEQAHVYLGNAQRAAGGKDAKRKAELLTAAVATFNAQLAKWPNGAQASLGHYLRGDVLYSLGKKDEAAKDFTIVVEKFGEKSASFGDALYSLGVIYQEQPKWEQAGKFFADFLNWVAKTKAKHALTDEVRMRYGETLLERQQFSEAEKWLQVAADAPGFALADLATSRIADSFSRRKKYAEAARLWLSIPEKFPKLGNIDPNSAHLQGGRNAYLAGEYDLSRTALSKVIPLGGEMGAEAAHWTAVAWLKQQKPAEALKVVEAALPKAAGTVHEPDLLMDRGDAMFELPERQKASAAAFFETYSKFPTHRVAAQALYNAAFAALRTGDFTTAAKYAQDFRQKFANHALLVEVIYVEAESHLLLKAYDKAAPLYAQLLKTAPQHRDVDQWKLRMGQVHFLQNKFDAAVAALQPLVAGIKAGPQRAQAYYLLGTSQLELKQPAEAVKSLTTAIEFTGQWGEADDARVMLARALRQMKDPKSGITHLRHVLEKFPNSNVAVDAHFHLAECLYDLGDYKAAVPEYQWVIDHGKGTSFVPYALLGQGWTFKSLNDAAAAQRAFQRLVDEFPKHVLFPRAHVGRATASQQLKQFDKAEADFVKFLSLEPNAPDKSAVRHELGKSQAAQKKYAEAVKTFTSVLTEDKTYSATAELLRDLAWALHDSGQPAEAAKRFQEVAEKSPESALGLEALYQVAEQLYAQKDYTKAAKQYFDVSERAEKVRASNKVPQATAHVWRERALHKYGWCYFHLGDFGNAEKTFGSQLGNYPKGESASDASFMLAESQFKQKKYEPALEAHLAYGAAHAEGRFVQLALLRAAQAANLAALAAQEAGDSAKAKKLFERALELMKKFIPLYPSHELLPDALYEQGWSLQNLEKYDEAIKQYEAVIARTRREVAAKARFMIGEIYFAQKKHSEAIINFSMAISGYGYPEWQKKATYEMARCLEVQMKKEPARKVYKELIEKFPDSEEAKDAKKRLEALGE